MTYDTLDTGKIPMDENVELIPSIHRYLVGDLFYRQLRISKQKIDKKDGVVEKIYHKVRNLYDRLEAFRIRKKFEKLLKTPEVYPDYKYFQDADLFVQSGGGYFVGRWIDSVFSHSIELFIAHKLNVKSLIIGQSIGPFLNEEIRETALIGLKVADLICVRDQESVKELRSYGLHSILSPDVVLSESKFNYEKESVVVVILGSNILDEAQLRIICIAIEKALVKTNYLVKVLVTRLWGRDIANASNIYEMLKKYDVNVSLIIPKDYKQLQDELGKSKVVISQNLHGLIMGWRSGASCVSLNKSRKFIAFMEQSQQFDRIMSINELTESKLMHLILNAIADMNNGNEMRHEVADSVRDVFFKSLDKVTA